MGEDATLRRLDELIAALQKKAERVSERQRRMILKGNDNEALKMKLIEGGVKEALFRVVQYKFLLLKKSGRLDDFLKNRSGVRA